MLRQLPKSGDWIDPREITSVEACKANLHADLADGVIYWARTGPEARVATRIPCDTYEEACTIRDEIAAMVNAADAGEG